MKPFLNQLVYLDVYSLSIWYVEIWLNVVERGNVEASRRSLPSNYPTSVKLAPVLRNNNFFHEESFGNEVWLFEGGNSKSYGFSIKSSANLTLTLQIKKIIILFIKNPLDSV